MALAPIVCGVDDRYVGPLCALMRSFAVTHGPDLAEFRMIVLGDRLSDISAERIGAVAHRLGLSVELRPADADRGYPVDRWVSRAVYLRLAIPDAVDEPVVLYLDADLLIVRDLRPLLNQPLQGKPLGAVQDPHSPLVGVGLGQPGWRDLGLPEGRQYFNSGVMLLDLAECQRRDVFGRAHYFLREYPQHAQLWDQDALNWSVDDHWLRLDRRWNTFVVSSLGRVGEQHHRAAEQVVPLSGLIADERTAAILHYSGPEKPWESDYPAGPFRDLYRAHLAPVGPSA